MAAAALVVSCTGAPGRLAEPSTVEVPDDPALVAYSVLPPGNGNLAGPTAAHRDDQRYMYDHLDDEVADGTLDDADLGRYFKDSRLGSAAAVRTDEPAPGVRIEWDAYGVPRVVGDTDLQVAYGAGWAVAESRLLIAELGRLLGRAGTIEMGGSGDLARALSRIGELPRINYTDAELEASMAAAVAAAGPEGNRMLAAVDAFVAGLNAWIDTHTLPREVQELGLRWRPWTRADVLAVGIIVDDIFGSGGGDETGNAAALAELVDTFGETGGRAVFDDLRMADDPAATTHVRNTVPYPVFAGEDPGGAAPGPANAVDPAAVALPDTDPAPTAGVGSGPEAAPPETPLASNYLVVGAERSASGHPVLVGGPQSSYFQPQLLLEMELHGGGYDARGVTFPGLGPWVVIGRSRSYAWTATAGGSDLTDERVERLCEPDGSAPTATSVHYRYEGRCLPMSRPDDDPLTAWRTVHGPVVERTTVAGEPVAVTRQRMSRGQAAHAAPAFWALNHHRVTDAADFAPTMASVPMSFNWVYLNAHDVAYFHSGWYPVRARGVDPDLPSWGTGEWEWRGRVDWRDQPRAVNPDGGLLVSWNNKIAPGWSTADNEWGVGALQRVDELVTRAEGLQDASPADVVAATQDAATVDLRGEMLVPTLLDVLGDGPAPNADLDRARRVLAEWSAAGAHRRDRADDGFYDDLAVPLMDALQVELLHRVFRAGLGDFLTDPELRRPATLDMLPSQYGSAWGKGWYSILDRDLRRAVGGEPVPDGLPVFCGGGDPAACRQVVWEALGAAAWSVGPWPKLTVGERIRFLPYLSNPESMRWQNRPTFQQVMSFAT